MLIEHLGKLNFDKGVSQILLEKEMLDISIQNADKIKNKDTFLKDEYSVEEKFDGTKLSVWRNDEDWDADYTKNWVVAFKNQILYGEEFESTDRESTKKHSVGISQYAFVHDHLKKVHSKAKSIPKGTEFFIEFIQNKLTTTRDYKNQHGLYLIAHSPASGEIEGGMLKTRPSGFFQDKVETYSKALSLNLPPVVFMGKLDSVSSITNGIMNKKLKTAWDKNKDNYDADPYETVKKTFLEFESVLGGKTEGVVLHSKSGKIYKFLQADQHDKSVRFAKKMRYQADPEIEKIYWERIKKLNSKILKDMDYDFAKLSYQQILKTYSDAINGLSDAEIEKTFAFKFAAMRKEGKMQESLMEAGGEKAGKFEVDKTSADIALKHLKSEVDTSGKDWEEFLGTFEKNYNKLKSLVAKGKTKRVDMPVVGSKQVGELQQRLEQGRLDIIDHKTQRFHKEKAFPEGLSGQKAKEWLEAGLKDGDLKDDIINVKKGRKAVGSLTPIQEQIYAEIPIDMVVSRGVKEAIKYVNHGSTIIVSKDGYILDGHHRWAAGVLLNPKLNMNVMIVDIPKEKLIKILLSYGDALGNKRNG